MSIRTLRTLPRYSELVKVHVLSISIDISEDSFDAYAEVEDHTTKPEYPELGALPMASHYTPKRRRGKVQLPMESVNLLSQDSNYNWFYMVEESHVEWE